MAMSFDLGEHAKLDASVAQTPPGQDVVTKPDRPNWLALLADPQLPQSKTGSSCEAVESPSPVQIRFL